MSRILVDVVFINDAHLTGVVYICKTPKALNMSANFRYKILNLKSLIVGDRKKRVMKKFGRNVMVLSL